LFLEPAVKSKMLTFVLPTEKRLGHFFKLLGNQGELERTETNKYFLLMQGYLSKVKLQSS